MFAVSELPTIYYPNWNNGSRIRCIHINLFDPLQHIISNDKLAKNSVFSVKMRIRLESNTELGASICRCQQTTIIMA